MKRRFTEEQMIRILKEHEGVKGQRILSGSTVPLNRHFTAERASSAAWM